MPGVMRYPPSAFEGAVEPWQARMGGADYQRVSRVAEEFGFDALVVPEHLAVPVELEPNLGGTYPHALTAMAFIAGATSTIRVNSMLIALPVHHPLTLAKAISTLDVMSGGRVTVTLGAGMAEAEFEALGVPFERRGRITDEYVDAMQVLWTQDRPEFDGEFVRFGGIVFEPKPVQLPHPPLWFGGRSVASLYRAAHKGDGWAPAGGFFGTGPWLERPEQLPALLDEASEIRAAAGRGGTFDVFCSVTEHRIGPDHAVLPESRAPTSAQEIVDRISQLERLGVSWTMVTRPGPEPPTVEAYLENLQWVAEEIIPQFVTRES